MLYKVKYKIYYRNIYLTRQHNVINIRVKNSCNTRANSDITIYIIIIETLHLLDFQILQHQSRFTCVRYAPSYWKIYFL